MDYLELLKNRRAIRDYEEKPVPLEIIREIINDAVKAPNAGNRQIWSFIIVDDKDLLKRISDSNKRMILKGIERNPNSPMKRYEETLRDENYNVFYNAPCVVFIIGPAKAPTTAVDCALAAAYLMLAATQRGLGTCWSAQGGLIRDKEILQELGLPEGQEIVAPILLGYPKGIPAMPERKLANIIKKL
jgi:nitroreductase